MTLQEKRESREGGIIVSVEEGQSSFKVELKKPNSIYFNQLLCLKCGPDLLLDELYPNAKEVTESMGAYDAVKRWLFKEANFGRKDITVVVVGDGGSPRTGGLFAYRTGWECVSVDPALNKPLKERWKAIRRLRMIPKKIEEADLSFLWKDYTFETKTDVVVVAVHSHANLTTSVNSIEDQGGNVIGIVAIPCCFEQVLDPIDFEQIADYQDWGIWSDKRNVKVWVPNG